VAAAVEAVPQRIVVHNKADLLGGAANGGTEGPLHVSALTGSGLAVLHQALRAASTGAADAGEGAFTARARHVDSLRRAADILAEARTALDSEALELAAESLRLAHDALGAISGRVLADDLLGRIFASFCIGK
jgi:tRNA modification GTPase